MHLVHYHCDNCVKMVKVCAPYCPIYCLCWERALVCWWKHLGEPCYMLPDSPDLWARASSAWFEAISTCASSGLYSYLQGLIHRQLLDHWGLLNGVPWMQDLQSKWVLTKPWHLLCSLTAWVLDRSSCKISVQRWGINRLWQVVSMLKGIRLQRNVFIADPQEIFPKE